MLNTTNSVFCVINATLRRVQWIQLSCDLVLNIRNQFRSQSQWNWISRNKIERWLLQCFWVCCIICDALFEWSHNRQNIVISCSAFDYFSFDAVSIVVIVFKGTNKRSLCWEYISIVHLNCRSVWTQCNCKIWIDVVFCLVIHESHCLINYKINFLFDNISQCVLMFDVYDCLIRLVLNFVDFATILCYDCVEKH